VADRVVEQVANDPRELRRGHLDDGCRLGERAVESHALRARHRPRAGDRVGDHLAERHALDVEVERGRLDTAQVEQVVDEPGETFGLHADARVVRGDRCGVVDHAVLDRLDHGADAGQRRPQVVRHPRHELTARSLECPLARNRLLELRGRLTQRSGELVRRAQPRTERVSGQDPDGARRGEHDDEGGEVVRRHEHRVGGEHDAGHRRGDGRKSDDDRLQRDRPRGQHRKSGGADERHRAGATGCQRGELDAVTAGDAGDGRGDEREHGADHDEPRRNHDRVSGSHASNR
jgi:hypothetical protein